MELRQYWLRRDYLQFLDDKEIRLLHLHHNVDHQQLALHLDEARHLDVPQNLDELNLDGSLVDDHLVLDAHLDVMVAALGGAVLVGAG